MNIKLSIIILSWNTAKLLKECLESIVGSVGEIGDVEVIVVDNGSADGSVEYINELTKLRINGLKIKSILNKENVGFARGNNQGIREARGEYIMLLNSDTIIKEGSINKLIEYLEINQNTAISPMLILPDNKPQSEYYMKFPILWQIFLYHNPILRPVVMKVPFLRSLIAGKSGLPVFEVDQLPASALISKKEIWDKVGLLDENYNFFFEDVDWCWRAKESGIKLMVLPESEIIHIGGGSWKKKMDKNKNNFYYQFFSSMLLFVKKNYSKKKAVIFKWAIIINLIITLKPKLAVQFIKNNGNQREFLD